MATNERAKCNNQNFECDLSKHITSISPITCRFPPVDSGDGDNYKYKVYQAGQPVFGNITLEGAEHKDSIGDIKAWVKQAYDGVEYRKDLTIKVYDQAQQEVRSFNLFDCFPLHFNILNVDNGRPDVVHWTLEIRVPKWEAA